jgi:hypothetical protein
MLTDNKRGLIDTLRVHIAPVGFEVDRIVLLAIGKKLIEYGLLLRNLAIRKRRVVHMQN